jgi:hypothetical protein
MKKKKVNYVWVAYPQFTHPNGYKVAVFSTRNYAVTFIKNWHNTTKAEYFHDGTVFIKADNGTVFCEIYKQEVKTFRKDKED